MPFPTAYVHPAASALRSVRGQSALLSSSSCSPATRATRSTSSTFIAQPRSTHDVQHRHSSSYSHINHTYHLPLSCISSQEQQQDVLSTTTIPVEQKVGDRRAASTLKAQFQNYTERRGIQNWPQPRAEYLHDDGEAFLDRSHRLEKSGEITSDAANQLRGWFKSYHIAAQNNPTVVQSSQFTESLFRTLLELCRKCSERPIPFDSIHRQVHTPFDYYQFGFEFASTLMNMAESTVVGEDNLRRLISYVQDEQHNVVLLSNHQSEGDPYALDMLLRFTAGCDQDLCQQIFFMAGDRVRDDPVVMPFSAGRNLLTVYSKKHMNDQPHLREEKILHNKRTLAQCVDLFNTGGAVVWMAPSGGRDRRSAQTGRVEISRFDQSSIDMMKLIAQKSKKKVHFFPTAIWSYDMLPPPTTVGGCEIGEERTANFIPMHLFVGKELVWDEIAADVSDRAERRTAQCDYVQKVVEDGYRQIGGYEY